MSKQVFLSEKTKIIITIVMFAVLTLTIMVLGILIAVKQDKKTPNSSSLQININKTDNSQ